jgi:signal transduction histidine kinase
VKAGPALRVAVIVTLLTGCVYVVAAVAIYGFASARLTSKTDGRLSEALTDARQNVSDATDDDTDSTPVYLWSIVRSAGSDPVVTARPASAPALPTRVLSDLPRAGTAVTVDLGRPGTYRLLTARDSTRYLVTGVSTAGNLHTLHLLIDGELVAGPLLLLIMFGGSLIVGLRALAPVEQARQRQLEFTADASHELRTPLSVLQAEVDVALSTRRTATAYRDSLVRVKSEGDRLRHLVDDLLWLARFDSQPPPPGREPVDIATLAAGCADRFRAIGPAITADTASGPALISAPPEWIDRLMGVLMDNACRYAGPDGQVRIGVRSGGGRLALVVEDSGPGIPEDRRARLFDRFERADEAGSGTGLGLAIGDSIVRSTGGRWRIAASPLGGALVEVSWRHPRKLP